MKWVISISFFYAILTLVYAQCELPDGKKIEETKKHYPMEKCEEHICEDQKFLLTKKCPFIDSKYAGNCTKPDAENMMGKKYPFCCSDFVYCVTKKISETSDEKPVKKPDTSAHAKSESPKPAQQLPTASVSPTPAPAPEVMAPAPEVMTPTPEVIAPAPEVITPAPEVMTPAPEVVTPAPESPPPAPPAESPAPSE